MYYKKGEKVSHFMSTNKIGVIVDIIQEKTNIWTTFGVPDVKTLLLVEYSDKSRQLIPTSDAIKSYD
jgi:hypothetical protein